MRARIALPSVLIATFVSLASLGDWDAVRLPHAGAYLTEAEYDSRLAGQAVDFDEPNAQSLGPVALRLLTLAEYDQFVKWSEAAGEALEEKDLREMSIDIKMISLPNFNLDDKLVHVHIDRAWSAEGRFDVSVGASLGLREFGPRPAMLGQATVVLPPGMRAGDVTKIEGRLRLRLPLELQSLELDPFEVGAEASSSGLTLTLIEKEEQAVVFQWDGAISNLLAVVAFDEAGEPLKRTARSLFGTSDEASLRKALVDPDSEFGKKFIAASLKKRVGYSFAAPVAKVRAEITDKFAEREFRFHLTR